MVQLPLGRSCPFLSRPVQVDQNWVCKTMSPKVSGCDLFLLRRMRNLPRPPGVGEQQVFWMAVVFSQEYDRGSARHACKLGNVLGTVKRPRSCTAAFATDEASKTARDPARRAISFKTRVECNEYSRRKTARISTSPPKSWFYVKDGSQSPIANTRSLSCRQNKPRPLTHAVTTIW